MSILTFRTSTSHGYRQSLQPEPPKSSMAPPSFIHTGILRQHINKDINKLCVSVNDVPSVVVADPAHVAEITWQIVVGALAGVIPFVVAGIEFSKKIIAQKRCEVCNGSGLVFQDKDYFKCPQCGGFLPWQSWKRFFSG